MRRVMLVGCLAGILATGCPDDPGPSSTGVASSGHETTDDPATDDDPSTITTPMPATGTETGEAEAWFEAGWGTNDFNAFEGTLPVVVGPQGLHMFSMPIRGTGFYNPPDPSFDNPDMPMLQAWVDIEGYALSPGGHFNEVVDYPALFYPVLDSAGVLEGPAVWLVLPDSVEPMEIEGLAATLHAELLDTTGLLLTDDHELVVGEIPSGPGGR